MCDVVKKLEEAGIPAVAIIFEDLAETATEYTRQIRMPDMRNIIIPHMGSPQKSRAYAPQLVPKLLAALTMPLTDKERKEETIPREEFPRIAVTGGWDECQEYFQGGREWEALFSRDPLARFTNGLPVVLPTEEKVKWMLTGTSHKPDETIGPVPVPDRQKEFTVETVAINAVMAGCRQEYMPILLAMAEMLATPARTRVGAGGGHSFLGVVSGPIARELKIGSERFSGEGNRANFSMRLAMNLIGHNAIGVWDQWGSGFIAEDIENSPWTPLGVDAGFKPDDNVFALCSAYDVRQGCISTAYYRAAEDKVKFLERLAPCIHDITRFTATIIIYPNVAKDLAAKGMSKEDVKQWLWEHTTETMGHFRDRVWYGLTSSIIRREGIFNRPESISLTMP